MHERAIEPEIMDQPDLDPDRHRRALEGLSRLNLISGSARLIWSDMRDLAGAPRSTPLRILDVATGSADVPIGVWRAAKKHGVPVDISACDCSPLALECAADRVRAAGARVRLFPVDLRQARFDDAYDVVICSLFMHHLEDEAIVEVLRTLAAATRRRLLVNELHRTRVHRLLVRLAAHVVTRSDVVHTDADRSVCAAFTPAELLALARIAGLRDATVGTRFPCRLMLRWDAE